jgi:ribosomal-protein-alanine N-acetyltransferase
MIGCVGFHWIEQGRSLAEIGYELLPDFHRKGIASEAILAVLHYAFNEIKLIEIEAGVNPDNSISINLLQKFGFKLSRHGKADYYFDGIYLDSDYYILTKKDFLNTI